MTSRSPTRLTPRWTSLHAPASNATAVYGPSAQARGTPTKICRVTTPGSSSSKTTSGPRGRCGRGQTKTGPALRCVLRPYPYVS